MLFIDRYDRIPLFYRKPRRGSLASDWRLPEIMRQCPVDRLRLSLGDPPALPAAGLSWQATEPRFAGLGHPASIPVARPRPPAPFGDRRP